jgi:hypothetical protein
MVSHRNSAQALFQRRLKDLFCRGCLIREAIRRGRVHMEVKLSENKTLAMFGLAGHRYEATLSAIIMRLSAVLSKRPQFELAN